MRVEPEPRKRVVYGKSGVSIANALDLGQRTNLDDLELSESIKEKLRPYLGLQKEDAQDALASKPLELSDTEAKEVSVATQNAYYDKAEKNFNKYKVKGGKDFESLPKSVKTSLFSRQFHTGGMGSDNIKKASIGDYESVIDNYKNSRGEKFVRDRRKGEAEYMQKSLSPLLEQREAQEEHEKLTLDILKQRILDKR